MPEGNSFFSLGNLGDLTKPATVLIEKIFDVLGGYFRPRQIRRLAKAEAEAEIIKAQTGIEVADIQRRALNRWVAEETKKQDNIERITQKAIPQLEESSNPQNIEDDWIVNFFDKCRIISDDEMQSLWARVLAGEANSPGTYSKRTVNFLSYLDKKDANLFTTLCGFGWFISLGSRFGDVVPLIFNIHHKIYNDKGINFDQLQHLDTLGLVTFNNMATLQYTEIPKWIIVFYYGTPLNIEFNKDTNFPIGTIQLTQIGQQLAPICGSEPVESFLEYVVEQWRQQGLILSSLYPRRTGPKGLKSIFILP